MERIWVSSLIPLMDVDNKYISLKNIRDRWRGSVATPKGTGSMAGSGTAPLPWGLASPHPQGSRICKGIGRKQLAGIHQDLLRGCFCLLCPPPVLSWSCPGCPWTLGCGRWCRLQVHDQGGAWATNRLCRAPSPAPFTAASVSFLRRGRGCTNYARL